MTIDYDASAARQYVFVACCVVLVIAALTVAYVHRRERKVRAWAVWFVLALPPLTALVSAWLLELPLESWVLLLGMALLADAVLYWAYRSGGFGQGPAADRRSPATSPRPRSGREPER